MSGLEPKLFALLGYLLGVGAGGALAARFRGKSVLAGRGCGRCGASLSPVAAAPFLSWFGVRPRCPRCGFEAPWLQAALETGIVLIGAIAILTLPIRWAGPALAVGFLLFVLAIRRWG